MIHYVAGFLFRKGGGILIEKNRPAWQAGKLNGVGGKVEPGETPEQAMRREFREEAGVDIDHWESFSIFFGHDNSCVIHYYRAAATAHEWGSIDSKTDENVGAIFGQPPENLVRNLEWILPMARDRDIRSAVIVEQDGVVLPGEAAA